jgi:hypothetical protein
VHAVFVPAVTAVTEELIEETVRDSYRHQSPGAHFRLGQGLWDTLASIHALPLQLVPFQDRLATLCASRATIRATVYLMLVCAQRRTESLLGTLHVRHRSL